MVLCGLIFSCMIIHGVKRITVFCGGGSFTLGFSVIFQTSGILLRQYGSCEVWWPGTSQDANLMALLHHLSLLAVCHSFSFTATHVAGKLNPVADVLSGLYFKMLHLLDPDAASAAASITVDVLDKLQPLQTRNAFFSFQWNGSFNKTDTLLGSKAVS